ncbi:MAG TPA: alpha/beta hydrolase [Chloroflexota bacterium]|nr:alpha/beta hydrolase [Chloroflexota bacterium]
MTVAVVRGVHIHYEILGESGPWVALSPGGHRDMSGVRGVGELLAQHGVRVLLHDRRNCGASDVAIEGEESEYELWADDLHDLLRQLGALPAFIGGRSSGCRLSLILALRHPGSVQGLLLWCVTGGPFAAKRLAHEYYGQYVEIARAGGMDAVCETPYFAERIVANAANGERLRRMPTSRFIEVFSRWRDSFLEGADLPVIGATAEQLRTIAVPTCVIPGNDRTHGRRTGETLAHLVPDSELHILEPEDQDVDVADWTGKDPDVAAVFSGFLAKRMAAASRHGSPAMESKAKPA